MKQFTTYIDSPVGTLQLRCSDDHITAVLFRERGGETNQHHPLLTQCITQLEEYFHGHRKDFQLPLLNQGSHFQMKVWELLAQIPYGKTITYNQLALQYGDIKAIRAVASANGKNNLSILIPCHRVIGSNQSLTGYAGGIWRKKWLLEHELKCYSGVYQINFL